MKQKVRVQALVLIIVLVFIGIGVGEAAETYKIGVPLPFSGNFSLLGIDGWLACQLATEEINASGGLLGRKIELFKADTKSTVAVAVRETKDLIIRNKVDVIVGPCSSAESLGVVEVTNEYKKIHMNPIGNAEKITLERVHPYLYQTITNSYMEAKAFGEYLANTDFNTYLTIAYDYEWGHSTVEVATEVLKKLKPNARKLKEFWPPTNETNWSSYITAILNEKPDVVISVMLGASYQSFVRQANGYDFFKKTKFLGYGYESDLMTLGREFPEGVSFVNRAPWWVIKDARKAKIEEAYLKINKTYPTLITVFTYDAMICLFEAIKRAGSFDADAVARALEKGKFKTLRGELYFRDIDHQMNSPQYIATSYFDKEKGFCMGKDTVAVPGEKLFRSVEEIKKIRAEKGINFVPWSAR